jgi:hypothetical protein
LVYANFKSKKSPAEAGLFYTRAANGYDIIPGMPALSSFGNSAIMASAVIISPEIEAALYNAERVSLVESRTPILIMSPYSSVAAL